MPPPPLDLQALNISPISHPPEAPYLEGAPPFDERILKNLTFVAYFDDPILPYALKEVLNIPGNKRLLKLYEASLPSWSVVLA